MTMWQKRWARRGVDIYFYSHAFNKDKKAFAIAKVGKQEKKEKTPISLKHIRVFFKILDLD
jgi:hypothetical protein